MADGPDRQNSHVDDIVKAVAAADNIYLATDPDREGEAISWHLVQILTSKKLLKDKVVQRVVFHEITKTAVLEAIAHPREVLQNLVDAQQTRRALDYLVGFNLSPLLWKKIRRGLSAGRVQSPALRLICERENEIRAFVEQEYWSVHIDSHKGRQKFSARLIQLEGKKLDQFDIPNDGKHSDIVAQLTGHDPVVGPIEKKKKTRNPTAPFTTSTLQQEGVRKLGMTTDRTMSIWHRPASRYRRASWLSPYLPRLTGSRLPATKSTGQSKGSWRACFSARSSCITPPNKSTHSEGVGKKAHSGSAR